MSSATSVIRYRPPRARADATAWLGMVLFLGSWAMMFAALFFAYGALRVGAAAWPPEGTPRLPLALPAAATAVLFASEVTLSRALSAVRGGRGGALLRIVVAAALGCGFLALQSVLWTRIWDSGLRPEHSTYASVFWALTVFHALHVLVGIAGLGWVATRAGSGALIPARHGALRLWTAYWHFVAVVWVVLYFSVFVL